jgi:hypothetical protein
MEAAPGKPDAGQHRGDRGRAERPVGYAEGELRRRRRLGQGQDRCRRQRADQGRGAARDGLQGRLRGSKPGEAKDKAIAGLRQVAALLDAKAPGDAAAYKSWLQSISQHVAEAAKEGGFLGFGGVQVSDAEKATLGEISSALQA